MTETPEAVVTKSQTESVTVSHVLPPVGDIVHTIIHGSSKLAKSTALVLAVCIAASGGLLYFNKDFFTSMQDYRVTIAKLESKIQSTTEQFTAKIEANTERFKAQSDIMELMKQKIIDQQEQIRGQQSQIVALQQEITRLKEDNPPPTRAPKPK